MDGAESGYSAATADPSFAEAAPASHLLASLERLIPR
jgi:hypothetical protein